MQQQVHKEQVKSIDVKEDATSIYSISVFKELKEMNLLLDGESSHGSNSDEQIKSYCTTLAVSNKSTPTSSVVSAYSFGQSI